MSDHVCEHLVGIFTDKTNESLIRIWHRPDVL